MTLWPPRGKTHKSHRQSGSTAPWMPPGSEIEQNLDIMNR